MPNRVIPVSQADAMVDEYLKFMKKHGMDTQKQTHNIAFSTRELLDWMQKVKDTTDEFRVVLGVYPPEHANAGRLTAIVWPYKNGKPALKPVVGKDGDDDEEEDPYNEGSLTP